MADNFIVDEVSGICSLRFCVVFKNGGPKGDGKVDSNEQSRGGASTSSLLAIIGKQV